MRAGAVKAAAAHAPVTRSILDTPVHTAAVAVSYAESRDRSA